MAIADRSAAEAAQRIADALEAAHLPYAIGGALALAIAGVPRGTADVDVDVFVAEERVPQLMEVLRTLGVEIDPGTALAAARREGMFVWRWDGMRVDVFLPSIPFAKEAERTRIRVTDAAGWSGWFLSAEALAVFKLLFFRGKDVVDLERMVAMRGAELDHGYVPRPLRGRVGPSASRSGRAWSRRA